jgi:divalent metal cation (Fe/Co/Zn/Cd) transporter
MPQDDPQALRRAALPHRGDVRSAWMVSVQSVVWTIASGLAAVAIGVGGGSVALVAFGSVGFVDAVGSAALAYHFRRGLRHETLSHRLERVAHRIVLLGLLLVGFGAVLGGGVGLMNGSVGESSAGATGLTALSLVVLAGLSSRKRLLARRVTSRALLGDSRLSAVGAAQAGVTLLGSATTRIGWHWADPAAAMVLGCVAMAAGLRSWRREIQIRRALRRSALVWAALGADSVIALIDAGLQPFT